MKLASLKSAVLGSDPVVRSVTDDGIGSYGAIGSSRQYLRPGVLRYEPYAPGQNPTDVERVLLRVLWMGSLNPRDRTAR